MRLPILALLVVLAVPASAGAASYATSESPYWKVGTYNSKLSAACQKGLFNQSWSYRTSIGFKGKTGRGVTGAAFKGWNLKDPLGLGQPGLTYHFFNDGYSTCRVFVAGKRGRR